MANPNTLSPDLTPKLPSGDALPEPETIPFEGLNGHILVDEVRAVINLDGTEFDTVLRPTQDKPGNPPLLTGTGYSGGKPIHLSEFSVEGEALQVLGAPLPELDGEKSDTEESDEELETKAVWREHTGTYLFQPVAVKGVKKIVLFNRKNSTV